MSQYITVPVNENGLIVDTSMNTVFQEAIAKDPFGFVDVYIYSHGWSTDATRALDLYNQFSVELAKRLLIILGANPRAFADPPGQTLGVGIHWPSEITENENSPLNRFQVFTFYTMEKRADVVGEHAVYSAIRLMLQARALDDLPLRFNLLGHSFGAKVVCSALNKIAGDVEDKALTLHSNTTFNVVLIEPATDYEDLRAGGCYEGIARLPSRVLTTFSTLDTALTTWYVDAGELANLFGTPRLALGAVGPGPQTIATYGGINRLTNRARIHAYATRWCIGAARRRRSFAGAGVPHAVSGRNSRPPFRHHVQRTLRTNRRLSLPNHVMRSSGVPLPRNTRCLGRRRSISSMGLR